MNKTIALAYAITGVAVAAALVAIIASTTGLSGAGPEPARATLVEASALDPAATEIVYVDAPPSAHSQGDDDDDSEHGHRGRSGQHERERDEEHDDD